MWHFAGHTGVKGNTKRLGNFQMDYPRKLQYLDRMCLMHTHDLVRLQMEQSGGVEQQQDTGTIQGAEDEDNMALD